jgi:hypothetical protein
LLDLVLASEQLVDLGQVVSAGEKGVGGTLGLVVALEVGLLTESAHLVVDFGCDGAARVEAGVEVDLLDELVGVAANAQGEHGGGKTGAVREDTDALALEVGGGDVGEERDERAVDGAAVHVAAHGGDLDGGLDASGETLLGEGHESLLNGLVADGLLVGEVLDVGGNLGEDGVLGVGQVVVVEQTGVALGDELARRSVEAHVVELVHGRLELGVNTVAVGVTVCLALENLLAGVVCLVAGVNGLGVALQGVVAVNDGVLAGQVGLVEVVGVLDVGTTETGLECERSVRADEHGNAASTASGPGSAFAVEGNVTSNDNGVAAVPRRGLDPVDGVEKSVGAAVAGVDGIHALNVGIARGLEKLHQHTLA